MQETTLHQEPDWQFFLLQKVDDCLIVHLSAFDKACEMTLWLQCVGIHRLHDIELENNNTQTQTQFSEIPIFSNCSSRTGIPHSCRNKEWHSLGTPKPVIDSDDSV